MSDNDPSIGEDDVSRQESTDLPDDAPTAEEEKAPEGEAAVDPGTSKEVALQEETLRQQAVSAGLSIGAPSATEWAVLRQQAKALSESRLVPSGLYKREADVLLIILTGRELAIPAVMALSRIHVVEGKPTLSAEVMRALVLKKGHRIRITERSRERVTVVGTRADDPDFPMTVTFDMRDAEVAGLARKDVWRKYPADMCLARATSALCRALFPDVLLGMTYAPEDFDAVVDGDGNVVMGQVVSEHAAGEQQQDEIRPLSPEETDRLRTDVFAAFDAEDPKTALTVLWQKVGKPMEVTMVADENGELVTVETLMRRAIAAFRDGGRLHDAAQPPRPEDYRGHPGSNDPSPTAVVEPTGEPDADGIVDTAPVAAGDRIVEMGEAANAAQPNPGTSPDEQVMADAVAEGEGEPAPESTPDDEAAQRAAAAPLVPLEAQVTPETGERAHGYLLAEVGVLARIFNSKVETLTAREERARKRKIDEWTTAELLTFVTGYREGAVARLRENGKVNAATAYGMLGKTHVADVEAMLAEHL